MFMAKNGTVATQTTRTPILSALREPVAAPSILCPRNWTLILGGRNFEKEFYGDRR